MHSILATCCMPHAFERTAGEQTKQLKSKNIAWYCKFRCNTKHTDVSVKLQTVKVRKRSELLNAVARPSGCAKMRNARATARCGAADKRKESGSNLTCLTCTGTWWQQRAMWRAYPISDLCLNAC